MQTDRSGFVSSFCTFNSFTPVKKQRERKYRTMSMEYASELCEIEIYLRNRIFSLHADGPTISVYKSVGKSNLA